MVLTLASFAVAEAFREDVESLDLPSDMRLEDSIFKAPKQSNR